MADNRKPLLLRMDAALPLFPTLERLLRNAAATTNERGAVSATRRLERVSGGRVALVGDASGSVDAITGEGLCLLFQEAGALAEAMAAGDLGIYERAHRRISRRPRFMSDLLLLLAQRRRLRRGRFAQGRVARRRSRSGSAASSCRTSAFRESDSRGRRYPWSS